MQLVWIAAFKLYPALSRKGAIGLLRPLNLTWRVAGDTEKSGAAICRPIEAGGLIQMNANSDSKIRSEITVANAQVSPDELGDVGRLLYGERWQSPLAAALGINDRTIRYWLAGTDRPGINHVRALIALLERSHGEASNLIVNLRERMDHAAGDVDEEVWSFGQNELQLIDDQRVLHVPTRTMITFHRYDNVSEDRWTPTGIVSNVGMFLGSALCRFQAEAWALIKRHHYRTVELP